MNGLPLSAYDGDAPYFFVCYSHSDSEAVLAEMHWFHDAGVNLWYDEGIEAGTTWRRALAEALDNAAGLIFLCSTQSLASAHCRKEVSYALDHDKPIFVVRLDDAELTPELALYLNDTQILTRDARQPDVYRHRLLTALARHAAIEPFAVTSAASIKPPAHKRLRPYSLAAAIAVLMAASIWYAQQLARPVPRAEVEEAQALDIARVAILPMEVLTPDATLEFLARVSEEDLRARMQMSVYEPINVPRAALEMSITEIGDTYDVDYVWYRSVARQGEVVRVAKRLAETRSGRDVRTYQHDLHGSDLFKLQDQLARYPDLIIRAVTAGEVDRANEFPLAEMDAYHLIYTTKGDRKQNIRRALELAPDWFDSNAVVAKDLFNDYYMQRTDKPDEVAAEALRLARRGWTLGPDDEFAIEVAARVELAVGSPDRAYSYVDRLLKLKSFTNPVVYDVLIATGRAQQALDHAEQNPLAKSSSLAHGNLALGRYTEAARYYQIWTTENPNEFFAWLYLANSLAYLDQKDTVEQIISGMRAAGWKGTLAGLAVGHRRFWGKSEFGETLLNGLRRLGYE